jgi:hypothetical protein
MKKHEPVSGNSGTGRVALRRPIKLKTLKVVLRLTVEDVSTDPTKWAWRDLLDLGDLESCEVLSSTALKIEEVAS